MVQYVNICSTTHYDLLWGGGGVSRSKLVGRAAQPPGAPTDQRSPGRPLVGRPRWPAQPATTTRKGGQQWQGGAGGGCVAVEVGAMRRARSPRCPPTARPCRAAGDGGRAAWPLGTAGAPKPARAAPPAPGSKGAGAARAGISDRPADRK